MQTITSLRNAGLVAIALFGFGLTGSAQAISLSTDALNGGNSAHSTLAVGANNSTGLEYVGFVSVSDASPLNIQYTQAGATIDVSQFVHSGAERGTAQQLQVNGYDAIAGSTPGGTTNLYLQGQPNVNNPGFGAHANWIVTFDLNEIRSTQLGGSTAPLNLTGQYGTWGAIGGTGATDGITQGVIYLDGVRIDSMGQTVSNPDGSEVNQSFNLNIPAGANYLSFGIFNGNDTQNNNTVWDDAVYQNVNLVAVPEPASLGLVALGGLAMFGPRRRA